MSTERALSAQDYAKRDREAAGDESERVGLPAIVESVLGSIGAKAFHNFKGSALEVWQKTALACGPDVIPGNTHLDKVIALCEFYVHQVQVAGDTPGEYIDGVRVVLIDDDNTAYAFVSDGIARDLSVIIAAFGMGPYDPPIGVKIKQGNTRKGRRFFSIQPA